jgi:hypothetical protein
MGRDLRSHDVEAEILARKEVSVTHSLGGADGRRKWYSAIANELKSITQEAISQLPPGEQSPSDWAATRAMWLPGGSSSVKQDVWDKAWGPLKTVKAKCQRSKKLVHGQEEMSLDELLAHKPAIRTRAATKNEPGLKRRPLHAADDTSYLIAAYASAGLEKTFSVKGSVMRQRPNDVVETTLAVQRSNSNHLVLCIDYSDYNKTHTLTTRMLLNTILAHALDKAGRPNQAKAARWIRDAHANHSINGVKINQGLSSGERDTARDNTTLHLAYAQVAYRAAGLQGNIHETHFFRCCGDDEILVGMDWADAIAYTDELAMQGHALQQRKIMLSETHGEFLQYNMFADGRLPTQPLAPALINFVSGSWYKATNYDPVLIPEQVSSAAGGLHRRGVALTTARKLAIACCNWLCKDTAWKKRLESTDLFGQLQTTPSDVRREKLAMPGPSVMLDVKGVRDYTTYMTKKYPTLTQLMGTQATTAMAWQSIYAQPLAELQKSVPPQEDDQMRVTEILPGEQPETKELARRWLNAPANDRADPMEILAFSCGLPAKALKTPALVRAAYQDMSPAKRSLLSHKVPSPWSPTWYERVLLPGAAIGLAN